MHKAWCYFGAVPCSFAMSSVTFQGHTAKQSSILAEIGRFRTVTPVWIHSWLRNYAQILKFRRKCALLFSKVMCQMSRSYENKKSPILTQNERFQAVAQYWIHRWLRNDAKKLDVVQNSCIIVFQFHPWNFKVTRLKKSLILTQIGCFRTITPV